MDEWICSYCEGQNKDEALKCANCGGSKAHARKQKRTPGRKYGDIAPVTDVTIEYDMIPCNTFGDPHTLYVRGRKKVTRTEVSHE